MSGQAALQRVDLPSGGWVMFHDPSTLNAGQLRPLRRMQLRLQLDSGLQAAAAGDDGVSARDAVIDDYSATLASVLLADSSFDVPLNLAGLRSIPIAADYQAILDAASKHERALLPPTLTQGGVS